MLKTFKYVIFNDPGMGEVAVLISASSGAVHKGISYMGEMSPLKAISAGFCHLDPVNPKCFGESVSLELKSRGHVDEEILKRQFYEIFQ